MYQDICKLFEELPELVIVAYFFIMFFLI